MPSFDNGYYAFTALIPLLPADADPLIWRWQPRRCSPVHSLRELLGSLRTVEVPYAAGEQGSPGGAARPIPFSCSDRTHFARLVVIEELAWNGRQGRDTLLELLWGALGFPDRQTIDRLPCPYLLVVLDFDAPDGGSASVENYLNALWASMEQEWTLILRHCRGFEPDPQRRRQSYLELLLRHEIDSTFTYTGYGWAAQQARLWDPATGRFRLPATPSPPLGLQLLILWSGLVLFLLGAVLVRWLGTRGVPAPLWLLLGGVALLLPLLWSRLYRTASQPWPAQPCTDLRSVRKALYLQGRFLELAEQRQQQGAVGSVSLRRLFRAFLEESQPDNRDAPSLKPGSIPVIRTQP